MSKKTLVNTETEQDVTTFLENVDNKVRQADAKVLLTIMEDITGKPGKIWGKSIVAFGKYKYQRKNGEEYEWFKVGFSPAKQHLSVYLTYDVNQEQQLLKKLGPHKTGKGCLYIKRLEQVDLDVLKKLIEKSDKWKR